MQAHQRATIPVAYEELTVDGTAGGFASLPSELAKTDAFFANGPINYRVDGPAPTASVGVPANDLDQRVFDANESRRFLAIRYGVTNGIVRAIHSVFV